MNFSINHIPERTKTPRNDGVTMVMDKGLSIRQVEDMISSSSKYIDIVKLGFGTAYLTENLEKKIKLYQEANFRVYFGGTLFESFIARDMFKEYKELVHRYQLDTVEVSDGCITLDHEKKCEYINQDLRANRILANIVCQADTQQRPNLH